MPSVTLTVGSDGTLTSSDQSVATTNGSTATFAAPASSGETYTITLVTSSPAAFLTPETLFNHGPNVSVSPNPAAPANSQITITCGDNIQPNGNDETVSFSVALFSGKSMRRHDPTMIFLPPD